MDLAEGLETCLALSLPSPARSRVSSQGLEACSAVSSTPSEAPVLQLSISEELDFISIETGDTEDSSLQNPACEELMEVITHAVAKLNIDWPAEKPELH